MNTITSRQNTLITQVASLHKRKNRTAYNQFIAEGLRTCTTLVEGNIELVYLFATERCQNTAREITDAKNIFIVSDPVMQRISTQKNPPGILGVFTIAENNPTINSDDKTVVLADVTDPGNMGTLIRTAVAFGFSKVICVEGTDVWSPKVVHATAGASAHISIATCSWNKLLEEKKDFALAALVVKNGTDIKNISVTEHILVIGNEAHGIRPEWLETCQEHVTIAMSGNTESLNASVAGAIALYSITKN